MKIRKGDTVKVLYGVNSGKTGVVVRVLPKKQMVVVDGVNVFKRHLKGDGQRRQAEIIDIVKPMPVAKVQLVDPSTSKPTRVGYRIEGEKKVRVGKKSGKAIEVVKEAKKVEKKSDTGKKADSKKATKKSVSKTAKKSTSKKGTK